MIEVTVAARLQCSPDCRASATEVKWEAMDHPARLLASGKNGKYKVSVPSCNALAEMWDVYSYYYV